MVTSFPIDLAKQMRLGSCSSGFSPGRKLMSKVGWACVLASCREVTEEFNCTHEYYPTLFLECFAYR